MSRYVTSGGHSHSCGIRTHVLIDSFDTAQAIGVFVFYISYFVVVVFFLNNNKTFWYNSGLISGFVGKSCCSETIIVTDFQGNMHTKVNWDSNPANKGDRCSRD